MGHRPKQRWRFKHQAPRYGHGRPRLLTPQQEAHEDALDAAMVARWVRTQIERMASAGALPAHTSDAEP